MQTVTLFAAFAGAVRVLESSMGFWDYLVWPLGQIFRFCYWLIPSFSLAVLLFAIIFKAVLFPLDIKRQRSQAKMVRFQPKINEIQKKYADNKEKMNEEMQKLYSEEGYSPMSGCLPSLLPLPIFLGLYRVICRPLTFLASLSGDFINSATEILNSHVEGLKTSIYNVELYLHRYITDPASAGWFSSLSSESIDKVNNLDMTLFGLDLTMNVKTEGASWVYWIFPVLTVVASIVSAFVMGKITKRNNEGMQGANAASNPLMVFGMPILTGVITYSFPAGVLLYWIYNSLLMMAVNLILNKFWPMKRLVAEYDAELEKLRASGKPVSKSSQFREKLLAAQEKNQAIIDSNNQALSQQRAAAAGKRSKNRVSADRLSEWKAKQEAEAARQSKAPDLTARAQYLEKLRAEEAKKKKKGNNSKAGTSNEGPLG